MNSLRYSLSFTGAGRQRAESVALAEGPREFAGWARVPRESRRETIPWK